MKRLKSRIPYIIAALIGGALTPWAIEYAAAHRGQAGQIGGEYLIIPFLWAVIALVKGILKTMKEVKE